MSSIWTASAKIAMPVIPPVSANCRCRSCSLVCRIISPRFSHSRSLIMGAGSGAGGSAAASVMSAVTPAMTMVPTSTLPPSSGRSDKPTSSSLIEASIVGSYSDCAGRFREVSSRRSPNLGKKLSSAPPSTTSSPPVLVFTCSCAISSKACSSINMGSITMAITASAMSPPTIHRITSISNVPCCCFFPAYQSGGLSEGLSRPGALYMLAEYASLFATHALIRLKFPQRVSGELV